MEGALAWGRPLSLASLNVRTQTMRILQVTDDLTLEIHSDDRPLVRLRSRAMARDRDEECAGTVVVYDEELDALVSALLEARRHIRGTLGREL